MTLNVRLILTHFAAAALAAIACLAGAHWGGVGGTAVGAAVGAVAAALIGRVAGAPVAGALRQLDHAASSENLELYRPSGMVEVDRLADRLCELARRWYETTARLGDRPHNDAVERSREMEGLLVQMSLGEPVSDRGVGAEQQLRHLLATIANSASADIGRILTLAEEISRRMQVMSSGAKDQAEAVVHTTSSVEQMSTHIDSISQNAEGANNAAVAARESAAKGQELVQELIRGMDRIRLHVDSGGRKLQALGERSQEIGSIVETIGSISVRTDMLALNASIESVRAGEHGRGFAVVAEEVRKLAEQTASATREVGHLIESMQLETQDSIATIAEERAQVSEEVRRVSEAGVALDHISETSTDSAQRVGEISRATLHQLRGTQEVVLAMQQISEIARGIGEGAGGARDAATTLTDVARQLETSLTPLYRCAPGLGRSNGPVRPERHGQAMDRSEYTGGAGASPRRTMALSGASEEPNAR